MTSAPTSSSTRVPPQRATLSVRSTLTVRDTLWSVLADVVVVLVFVAIGRRNHDGTVNAEGIFDVAAPFLLALVATWIIVLWRGLHPTRVSTGIVVWVGVVALGMILRKVVFDGGTATAFVIVATIFIGIAVTGWRAITNRLVRGSS